MSAAEKLQPAVQIKLKVLKGPHEGQSFHLSKSIFTVGRGPENEVVLINDPLISRQHARLQVVGQDIEITNLSKKNKVTVGSEDVQKWKLTNESTFTIGDTEIQIAFEIERSGVSVVTPVAAPPAAAPTSAPTPTLIPKIVPPPSPLQKNTVPSQRQQVPVQRQQVPAKQSQQIQVRGAQSAAMPRQRPQQGAIGPRMRPQGIPPLGMRTAETQNKSGLAGILANPKARFYLIVGVVLVGFMYWMNSEEPKKELSSEIKSTLKYEDEYMIKLNSVSEKELDQNRASKLKQKNSLTNLRIEENLQKGLRDFQLGNYTRALDFFQVVLNLDPNHPMARRHLYLSRIRFDEIVKAKLILGESYYRKHNFKMCQALYDQVLIMLQGKNNDQSYQTAQSMSKKCELAIEGIR